MEVYVKGAPEVMTEICDPESCAFNAATVLSESAIDIHFSASRLR